MFKLILLFQLLLTSSTIFEYSSAESQPDCFPLDDLVDTLLGVLNLSLEEVEQIVEELLLLNVTTQDVAIYVSFSNNKTVVLNNTTSNLINPSYPTRVIVHGWIDTIETQWVPLMAASFHNTGNYNVLLVEWSEYSSKDYIVAASATQQVGAILATTLLHLNQTVSLSFDTTHIIGHSLGAHVAGFSGKGIQAAGYLLDRVTGCDAAAPLFEIPGLKGPDCRLAKTDASFVDLIHTTAGIGVVSQLGDADFYVNDQLEQPDCANFDPIVSGYFWHITDIHYYTHHGDAKKGCWRPEYDSGSSGRSQRRPMGKYGDYNCDAPWELIESAARTMMSRQNDNVEFVLWTGDALSHTAKKLHEKVKLQLLQNLTELLSKTFPSQFVFPALGHDDPMAKKDELSRMWSRWLPTESLQTFAEGGYYMIERKMFKLHIVVLNTNLMKKSDDDEEAAKQWEWLNRVLGKFQRNGETVYLVGHIPPGSDERQRGFPPAHLVYTDYHNREYLALVRKYAEIIVGQFFGHLHSDTFRVIYGERGRPVSWALIAPSLTPRRNSDGSNNPGLRIYKFDKETGQILDYSQYYLDLSRANANSKLEAEWSIEYNFSSYYGISEITPTSLHQLADKLTSSSHNIFDRYYTANSVRMYSNPHANCDATCAHNHFCAITRVDYEEFEHCLKTAASALASSSFSIRGSLVLVGCVLVMGKV